MANNIKLSVIKSQIMDAKGYLEKMTNKKIYEIDPALDCDIFSIDNFEQALICLEDIWTVIKNKQPRY